MADLLAFSRRFATGINPRRSLKARLGLAIGGIALIFSILASLTVGYMTTRQMEANIGQSLAELAYQITDKLDRGMFERYRDIQILATLDPIQNIDTPASAKRELLEKLQTTYPDYAWIGLTNEQGKVLVSTGKVLEGKNVSERPWFQNAQSGSYVGDVHEALLLAKLLPKPTGEALRLVDVAAPVMDRGGNFRGVLGAHLSWGWAREVQKSLLQPVLKRNLVEVLILGRDGTVLLGEPELESKQLSLASVKAASAGQNGYRVEIWSNGTSYLTGFAQSRGYRNYPGLGWLVLVRQKSDIAFGSARNLQHQIFIGNAALGVLLATIGWMIADAIVHPLLAIAAAADRIRLGNTTSKIAVVRGKDEIAILSNSLSQLVRTLTQQEQELEHRVVERTAQLETANKELEAFSYSVSHDLRAPLRSIDGFSQVLLERYAEQLDDKGKHYLQRVRTAGQRMGQLIDDLLNLSRVTRSEMQHQSVDLSALVQQIAEELQQTQPECQVEFVIAPGVLAEGDPRLLRVVLENLLNNACKFTSKQAHPRIEFGTLSEIPPTDFEKEGNISPFSKSPVTYFVRDNGAGFDMAYANKLFGAFQRLHTEDEFPGTGIGLASVQRIIRRHGGRVWAEGAVDQGATFYFTLSHQ